MQVLSSLSIARPYLASWLRMATCRAAKAAESDWTRSDTPGVQHAAHFNAAGSSLPTQTTVDAACSFLKLEAEIGG